MGDYPSQIDHNAANSPEAKLLGGAVPDMPERAREASPVTYVTSDDPPFLILHGTEDMVVPFHQSVELDEKLQGAKVESIFIHVQEGGHGFNAPDADERVQAFFDKHLRGVEATISADPVTARTRRE
jgi:dipeptidyl aminopeptidase/acylaminoacyl peptidase